MPVKAAKATKRTNAKKRKTGRSTKTVPAITKKEGGVMPEAAPKFVMEEKPPQKAEEINSVEVIRKAPKVRIIIDQQENHEGMNDVRLGLNGYVINIKRGVEVAIPEPFIHILENAKYTIISKSDDGEDVERVVPRFNWHRV